LEYAKRRPTNEKVKTKKPAKASRSNAESGDVCVVITVEGAERNRETLYRIKYSAR
jgi:hypothetical protein